MRQRFRSPRVERKKWDTDDDRMVALGCVRASVECGELVCVSVQIHDVRDRFETPVIPQIRGFCTWCFFVFFLRHAALCLRDWLVCLTRFLCAFKRFSSWNWWSWWRYTKPVNVSYFSYFSLAQFVALLLHECFFHANHSKSLTHLFIASKSFLWNLSMLHCELWTVRWTLSFSDLLIVLAVAFKREMKYSSWL